MKTIANTLVIPIIINPVKAAIVLWRTGLLFLPRVYCAFGPRLRHVHNNHTHTSGIYHQNQIQLIISIHHHARPHIAPRRRRTNASHVEHGTRISPHTAHRQNPHHQSQSTSMLVVTTPLRSLSNPSSPLSIVLVSQQLGRQLPGEPLVCRSVAPSTHAEKSVSVHDCPGRIRATPERWPKT